MRKQDIYNYNNPKYAVLREPMRDVMSALGNAEKWFAAIKDIVLIDFSMPFLSDAIHKLEHKQPERVDAFSNAIHQFGLLLEYPSTNELSEEYNNDLDRVFEVCVGIIDEVDDALDRFIRATKDGKFNGISLLAEELQMQNGADREKLLTAWGMWGNGDISKCSFDSWCKKLFDEV